MNSRALGLGKRRTHDTQREHRWQEETLSAAHRRGVCKLLSSYTETETEELTTQINLSVNKKNIDNLSL